MGGFTAL